MSRQRAWIRSPLARQAIALSGGRTSLTHTHRARCLPNLLCLGNSAVSPDSLSPWWVPGGEGFQIPNLHLARHNQLKPVSRPVPCGEGEWFIACLSAATFHISDDLHLLSASLRLSTTNSLQLWPPWPWFLDVWSFLLLSRATCDMQVVDFCL